MVESYTEKCQIVIHLKKKEDQAYVKNGQAKSIFMMMKLGEQLCMVCDLKLLRKEGIRAVDIFGKDPQAMVRPNSFRFILA